MPFKSVANKFTDFKTKSESATVIWAAVAELVADFQAKYVTSRKLNFYL